MGEDSRETNEAKPSKLPPPTSPSKPLSPLSPTKRSTMQRSASSPAAPDPEVQAKLQERLKTSIKEAKGPSFEERVAVAAKKFQLEARATQEEQRKHLEEAKERAKLRPCASAARSKELTPPSFEDFAKEHQKTIKENMKKASKEAKARKHRMDTREPLFKVSEVESAFEAMRQRQEERKQQLQRDEEERWEHIKEIQRKVIDRPMLHESYERPVHVKPHAVEERLIPEHAKDTIKDMKIKKAVSRQWFTESAWGKEVWGLKEKMDARQKLSEIQYPPKKHAEPPMPRRIIQPMDTRMNEVIQSPWFKKSQWSEAITEMKQRQDDRPKLHEITYPKKH